MQIAQSINTVVALGNANELVANIVRGVLGNDVADTFNGTPLSRGIIYNLVQAEFQTKLAPMLTGAPNA